MVFNIKDIQSYNLSDFSMVYDNYKRSLFCNSRDMFFYRNSFARKQALLLFNNDYEKLDIYQKFYLTYMIVNKDLNSSLKEFMFESNYRNVCKKMASTNFLDNILTYDFTKFNLPNVEKSYLCKKNKENDQSDEFLNKDFKKITNLKIDKNKENIIKKSLLLKYYYQRKYKDEKDPVIYQLNIFTEIKKLSQNSLDKIEISTKKSLENCTVNEIVKNKSRFWKFFEVFSRYSYNNNFEYNKLKNEKRMIGTLLSLYRLQENDFKKILTDPYNKQKLKNTKLMYELNTNKKIEKSSKTKNK